MHYKELFKAIDWFGQDIYAYDSAYARSRATTNWKNIHTFSDDEIKSKVLKFLNDWKCRIGITQEVIKGIKQQFTEVLPYMTALGRETIEDVDFDKTIEVDDKQHKVSFAIYFAMNQMSNIGYRFRHVAASKLLHMVNPELFVMWDNFIINAYKISRKPESYTYNFLPLMKKHANEAIESYISEHAYNRIEALTKIRTYSGGKTLAKVVDEFNYWKYSGGYA